MIGRRGPSTVRLLLVTLLLGALALTATDVAAQEPDPAYDLTIGVTGEAAPDIPSQTVNAIVFNEDETADFGTCQLVTDATPGGCTVDVPPSTTVVVYVDDTALPAGIVPVENPIVYTTPAERTGAGDFTFEFVYADDGGEDPGLTYYLQLRLSGDPYGDIPDRSVSVSVRAEDGAVSYGSCAFDMVSKPDGCGLDTPAETTVVAQVDESTLPEGIVIVENPITYTTPAEKTQVGDIVFELAYADDGEEPAPPAEPEEPEAPADPGDVSELPSTGNGRISTTSDSQITLAGASAALAVITLAGGATIRSSLHR